MLQDRIVAGSDIIAIAALRCLADHQLRVPERVGIVEYDDIPFAAQTAPDHGKIGHDSGCLPPPWWMLSSAGSVGRALRQSFSNPRC